MGKSVPQLYWTTAEGSNPKKPSDRYVLGEDLRLPPVFQSDLSNILQLLVVTQSSAFDREEGHFVADRLRPFINRVRHLLEGDAAKSWSAEDIPLDWAMTQMNLGTALETLGERESGTARLEEAVAAYRDALQECTRERVPLDWATTQNNLGNALQTLGERESGTARLEEAVAAYRAALLEYTRERVPLDWAMTQNNLGTALCTLGERESGTARLEEAVAAYRAALLERTRERVPLDWAMTQNNLGNALRTLGERESGTARLEEAVAAYRAALLEYTRERVPLDWAMTQNNLGNALSTLGERESGTARLEEAVAAYRDALAGMDPRARAARLGHDPEQSRHCALDARRARERHRAARRGRRRLSRDALQEWTRERVPLEWAMTQNNLGNALATLGERESGTARLEEAVAAYREALQENTRERVPLDWAMTQNNLGLTPAQFGELADVPPELEWLANITNAKTRRAYKNDVSEFSAFTGLRQPAELRTITRAHVIAWRKDLEARALAPVQHPAQALGAVVAVRLSLRAQRRRRQSGRRRQAADGQRQRRQHAGARRCPGPQAARRAAGRYAQGRARSRHPGHPALSRHPPRGALRAAREGHAKPPGRAAFSGQGQARQDPVRSRACAGAAADRGIPGARRPRLPIPPAPCFVR